MKKSLFLAGFMVLFAAIFSQAQSENSRIQLPADEDMSNVASTGFSVGKDGAALYSGAETNPLDKKISLRVNSAPLNTALNSIMSQAGINFIMDEAFASKKVTASLTNVTVRDALDTILKIQGLTYQRIGQSASYVISKRSNDAPDVVTKIYTLNYISLQGNTGSTMSNAPAARNTGAGIGNSISDGTLGTNRPAGTGGAMGSDILSIISSTLTPQGKIALDPRTNKLIITDVPEVFPQLDNILAELDVRAPQILIEARIVELSRTGGMNLGLSYGGDSGTLATLSESTVEVNQNYLQGIRPGNAANPSGWNYIFPFLDSDGAIVGENGTNSLLTVGALNIVLKALVTRGEAKYLSKPSVVVLNNQPAVISATRDAALGENSTESTAAGNETIGTSAERQNIGLTLNVVPQVNREGYITLSVSPSFSTVQESVLGPAYYDPVERSLSTIVRVKSGQTVVLGGLLQADESTTVSKVPLLGDIPILGWLFTSKTSKKTNTDLVIFIKPTILAE